MDKKLSGFTLVELLVTLGILGVTVAIVFPLMLTTIESNSVLTEAKKLKSILFIQQQHAHSGESNSAHGVKLNNGDYVLFNGTSFDTATYTETIDLPTGVSIGIINLQSSGSEIVFNQGSLKPNTYGSITLTDGGNAYTININSEGLLELN